MKTQGFTTNQDNHFVKLQTMWCIIYYCNVTENRKIGKLLHILKSHKTKTKENYTLRPPSLFSVEMDSNRK